MAKEIERKFLVKDSSFIEMSTKCISICQAYLSVNVNSTVRVRIADDRAFLTIKSKTHGFERDEWEYEIPVDDARGMIKCCASGLLEKVRYIVPYAGFKWEVDAFSGVHQGLIVAEIELPSADTQFDLPPFIGDEVTGIPKYYNSYLAKNIKIQP